MIRKGRNGYYVVGKDGKKLSEEYRTKGEARKRLREIEYFKNKGGK